MTPAALGLVGARIDEIQQRFAVPVPFPSDIRALAAAPAASGVGVEAMPSPDVVTPSPGSVSEGGIVPALPAAPADVAPVSASPAAAGWAALLPAAGRPWAGAIEHAAGAAGLDPTLLAALVQAESGFRADARSSAGAIGLGQLMPGTARELGVDPHDPQQNLAGAARYLKAQLDRFGGVDLALAAYNAGPGAVARAGGVPRIAETQHYVDRVRTIHAQLRTA